MSRITVGSGSIRTTSLAGTTRTAWTRPSDWITMPSVTSSEQKVVMLYAILPNQDNWVAFTFTGNYTVDWGDGSSLENFASNVKAEHNFDYNDSDITATSSRGYKMVLITVTPQRSKHYCNAIATIANSYGSRIYTTGLLEIIASLPQCSSSGSGFLIGSSGTTAYHRMLEKATILNIGSVTALSNLFYNCTRLQSVDIPFSVTANVQFMNSMFQNCVSLASVPLFDTSSVTSMTSMFRDCNSLQTVPLYNTANVTQMNQMFYSCVSLQFVPEFDTSKNTTMDSMFRTCLMLKTIPAFDTANVTLMTNVFTDARSLQSIPYLNTSKVTSMRSMFSSSYYGNGLFTVPAFDTANVTNMSGMFYNCYNLQNVPMFNTSKVTNMDSMFSMFYGVGALESIPAFDTANVTSMVETFRNCGTLLNAPELNTANVTNMGGIFQGCGSLRTIPTLNTSKVTNMNQIFYACSSLQSIPTLNTANVISMNAAFQDCRALSSIPAWNVSSVARSFSSTFLSCSSLANVAASEFKSNVSFSGCRMSNTALNFLFTNLPTVTNRTITITSNPGSNTCNQTIATSKGWTVVN